MCDGVIWVVVYDRHTATQTCIGTTISRCHLSSAATVDPRTPVDRLFHVGLPGRITATAVSPYRDLGHGTVSPLNFGLQTFHSKHSDINWRHSCLQCNCRPSALAALRVLRYINVLNNYKLLLLIFLFLFINIIFCPRYFIPKGLEISKV